MSKRIVNDGRDALRDALVNGRNIQVDKLAVGSGGAEASRTDTGCKQELTREDTSNLTISTGESRFDGTLASTNNDVDGKTLRECTLQIDAGGDDDAYCRIRFADEEKNNGEEIKFEVSSTVSNP